MLGITHCDGFVSGFALARLPCGSWFFALFVGGRLAYGPLAAWWDNEPQLHDLEGHVHVPGRIDDLVVAVPAMLDRDDVRFELRRVTALASARFHIYTVSCADIAAALGLPASSNGENGSTPAIEDLRRAVGGKLAGVEVEGVEAGVLLALAHLVAGAQAHRAWVGRFGQVHSPEGR